MNGKKSRAPKSAIKRKVADPFFHDAFKKHKPNFHDEEIDSDSDDDPEAHAGGVFRPPDEFDDTETADEKRKRLANDVLHRYKEAVRKDRGDEDPHTDSDRDEDALVAERMKQDQLEDSGRLRRLLASRVLKPTSGFELLVKHRQSVTAVALTGDDAQGFSASKDGNILHWDVESGTAVKYKWPGDDVLKSHGFKPPQGRALKHSKQVLALAVSSDGRYLASGGLDRHVHLWDARTREHIQAFSGHKGVVSCLTFREGSAELFSGSYDRNVKIWNADDRAYVESLFGHSSDVLDINCLRKERVLAVGRDRTMQLFKVPEGTRLKFCAPASSLESCRFVTNDEFLSGADDGSVELWNVNKKKPVCIVKNAHAVLKSNIYNERNSVGEVSATRKENGICNSGISNCLSAQSWVSALTISRGSDLAASGAGNGCVRLWAIESEVKRIRLLYDLPLVGFVNSLAFAKSGKFLLAGVGQEPRLGRWGLVPAAQNGVSIQSIELLET
uniref:Uncharacterized protein n=1 Tax=Kalanchoe fedtschenkoi TaxID=63787 RepID=A0A7N0SVQ8_KALFE